MLGLSQSQGGVAVQNAASGSTGWPPPPPEYSRRRPNRDVIGLNMKRKGGKIVVEVAATTRSSPSSIHVDAVVNRWRLCGTRALVRPGCPISNA